MMTVFKCHFIIMERTFSLLSVYAFTEPINFMMKFLEASRAQQIKFQPKYQKTYTRRGHQQATGNRQQQATDDM